MRFGANTFIWTSPFSTNQLSLIQKVHDFGFDVFEIAVEDPALIDLKLFKRALDDLQMGVIVCGVFGPDRDLSSEDHQTSERAAEYLRWCIHAAQVLGAPVIGGPMHSAVGKARPLPDSERAAESQRVVKRLQAMADYAQDVGVNLALELLNRFENDMLNIVDQGMEMLERIDRPNVGLHLDTFHMHIEEKDPAAAIRRAGDRVFHFHACENDRGVPGTGQVRWQEITAALRSINYSGAVVIESFTPEVKSIARAVNLWRPVAPSQDAIAQDGLAFLRSCFE